MLLKNALALALAISGPLCAQLTLDQKTLDFQQTAAVYWKNYGPYEWKQRVFQVDLLDTGRWLARIRDTRTDLEYYQIMSEWVAQLNDAHDVFLLPSNFVARLNFSVDIYDGKLLVDSINRTRLPAAEYPFVIGYELVSVDGEDPMRILNRMLPYSVSANERSTRRTAASWITLRPQQLIPNAPATPDFSTVVFRRFDGELETYRLPWTKTGVPLGTVGKFPGLRTSQAESSTGDAADYIQLLNRLQNCRVSERAVVGVGAVAPLFASSMPPGFVQRLGRSQLDYFYSGTFPAGGYRIGFIRIPSYSPANFNEALTQFVREIAYFNQNTDGLIVDQMRNPGGSVSYVNTLLSYLFHYRWASVGFSVRATSVWVRAISSAYESAKAQRAPAEIIDQLAAIRDKIKAANAQNRALTEPIPLDGTELERNPVRDRDGNLVGYWRPIMVLMDEFSASGADMFPATMQDNGRAVLFGMRTMGAGGNVTSWDAGTYSDGTATLTESLMVRKHDRFEAGGLPVSPYIENVGVHPEIEVDYMTRENLIQRGAPFVEAFTNAMVEHIRRHQ